METPDEIIERQGQMIVKQAEELHDHERVMKLLRDRFPIREDGSHSDYAVEDVLTENARQREQIQRMEGWMSELLSLINDCSDRDVLHPDIYGEEMARVNEIEEAMKS